ncbi:MAG: matrixin family metalloprotease [Patescibacteria group bacterium]
MKKGYFVSLVLIVLLVLIGFLPIQTKAKQKQPRIFIQYQASPNVCRQTSNDQAPIFTWAGFRLKSGITDYKINFSTLPRNFSQGSAIAIFDMSFSTIQGGGGGILFHYAGESNERSPSNDGQNTVMWRTLSVGIAAVTYVWLDTDNHVANVDTAFNSRYRWSYTNYNGQNDCGGVRTTLDLRNVATHEFGHWTGLGDLYSANARDLTMYGYAARGELKKDNLGVGDIIGIRAVWP